VGDGAARSSLLIVEERLSGNLVLDGDATDNGSWFQRTIMRLILLRVAFLLGSPRACGLVHSLLLFRARVCRRENSYGTTFSGMGAVRASQSARLCFLFLHDYFPTEPFLAARQRADCITDMIITNMMPCCRDKAALS
jgi:hypothetical protein